MIREIKINNSRRKINVDITYLSDIEEYNAKIIDPENGKEYEGFIRDNEIHFPEDWYHGSFEEGEDYINYLKDLFGIFRIPYNIDNTEEGITIITKIDNFNIIKNDMKQLNEIKRMQQLAGIKEIKINHPLDSKQLEDVKEYLLDIYDSITPEDAIGGEEILYRDKFGSEDYDDYEMYEKSYQYIKRNGGKLIIDDYDPVMTFTILGNNIVLNYSF